ncbi:MAG: Transcriptional regulator, XRE family [Lachnoclostridium sp.]|jgi:putative transcriptional regulator
MKSLSNISYNKLWKLLIDKKMKKKDLIAATKLSSTVIAKMGRDESVHLDTLVKICKALHCKLDDIVEIHVDER